MTSNIVFKDFLEFLEKSKNRTRPAHDGVVLFTYSETTIANLLKLIRRMNMEHWFWKVVASVGCLSTYVEVKHSTHPRIKAWKQVENLEYSASMEGLYYNCFHNKVSFYTACNDLRANYLYQILTKLLQEMPTYKNLFKVNAAIQIALSILVC